MKGLFTVLCRACGWTSPTDKARVHERHRCPKCGSADLQIGPKP